MAQELDEIRAEALGQAVDLVTSGRLAGVEGVGIGTVVQAAEQFHLFLTADPTVKEASEKPSATSSTRGSAPKPSTPTPPAQPDAGDVTF